ncbi:26S proteasome SU (nucleomorph) [Cryptomonas paramecium]|uniref:26S proteasome SU n=1 Tax=Cryptomonas paramaecium TaxID=2898 RepID=F2HHL1_9CRYP|nr:26S proteasome SU [Cryptomonas paramecium]AEA38807.1 26S proteasome SU [Cryptomonas paramecium]|mmetsp:Transcript_58688/g.155189  ORF Transcript_58688/g.155189 Transcript_58688/m.155189 type:complete len:243 (-) Transcript_58688:3707-4435(-)
MSRKYDIQMTSFSPEGRLKKIENVLHLINREKSLIAIKTKEGILLAVEKEITFKLNQDSRYSDDIFLIDNHIFCATTGIKSDIPTLINYARLQSQVHKQIYQTPIPIENLVNILCDIKQKFTQFTGKRIYKLSLIITGWDDSSGFQLFHTDPSGNYSSWQAIAVGRDNALNQDILNQEVNNEIDLQKAIGITAKIFCKKFFSSNLFQLVDLIVIRKDGINNTIYYRFNPKEIKYLYKKIIEV